MYKYVQGTRYVPMFAMIFYVNPYHTVPGFRHVTRAAPTAPLSLYYVYNSIHRTSMYDVHTGRT